MFLTLDPGSGMERDKSRIRITAKMALSFDILGATAGRGRHQKNTTPVWEEDSEEPGDNIVDFFDFLHRCGFCATSVSLISAEESRGSF